MAGPEATPFAELARDARALDRPAYILEQLYQVDLSPLDHAFVAARLTAIGPEGRASDVLARWRHAHSEVQREVGEIVAEVRGCLGELADVLDDADALGALVTVDTARSALASLPDVLLDGGPR